MTHHIKQSKINKVVLCLQVLINVNGSEFTPWFYLQKSSYIITLSSILAIFEEYSFFVWDSFTVCNPKDKATN